MNNNTAEENSEINASPVKPPRGSDLKKRTITAAVYILVLVAFFVLKITVNLVCFDALVLVFSGLGTYEMLRAFRGKLHKSQQIVVMVFALAIILTYAVTDAVYTQIFKVSLDPTTGRNYAPHITFVVFIAGLSVLFGLLVFAHQNVTLESTGCACLCYLYPSVFLLVLSFCNHMPESSEIAILFVFVICPFADTFAFLFGKLFGRYLPAKIAPSISPNKTVIGCFGGLLGGAVGAVVIFFIYYWLGQYFEFGALTLDWINLVFYIGLGVLTAAFTEFGDLVESGIKRKLGIKDMGKVLPGHGGVLDRIDSTLYASLIVCLVVVVKIMITG